MAVSTRKGNIPLNRKRKSWIELTPPLAQGEEKPRVRAIERSLRITEEAKNGRWHDGLILELCTSQSIEVSLASCFNQWWRNWCSWSTAEKRGLISWFLGWSFLPLWLGLQLNLLNCTVGLQSYEGCLAMKWGSSSFESQKKSMFCISVYEVSHYFL